MKMNPLNDLEEALIRGVVAHLPSAEGLSLLSDLQNLEGVQRIESQWKTTFVLQQYARPPYRGQHPYPVEIRVNDADGSELTAILFADENGRLFELELIRWDAKPIEAPVEGTLRFY